MKITQTDTELRVDTKWFLSKISGSRQFVIQKDGMTSVTGTGWFGRQLDPVSFPTNTIVAVQLVTYLDRQFNDGVSSVSDRNRSGDSNPRSRLSLQLNTNDLVEIGSKQSSGGFKVNGINVSSLIQKAPLSDEAQQIASFLNIPLNANDNTNTIVAIGTAFQAASQAVVQNNTSPPTNATGIAQPTTFSSAQPAAQEPARAAQPVLPSQPPSSL